MANFVKMFKPRFALLVKTGEKRQTIRPTPKRMPKSGDCVSLREWSGKPYRSKQATISSETLLSVSRVEISECATIAVSGKILDSIESDSLAKADGFSCTQTMIDWFKAEHGLPFDGILLKW